VTAESDIIFHADQSETTQQSAYLSCMATNKIQHKSHQQHTVIRITVITVIFIKGLVKIEKQKERDNSMLASWVKWSVVLVLQCVMRAACSDISYCRNVTRPPKKCLLVSNMQFKLKCKRVLSKDRGQLRGQVKRGNHNKMPRMMVALADVKAPRDYEFRVVARRRDLGQRRTSKPCSPAR
jgi:hypothetical protein